MDDGTADGTPPPAATFSRTSFPSREDCWSEDATQTLIDAWGRCYLELNRGNLRQKHWQEVADAVNTRHGHVKKARRTDVQCKNRIDTLKKKYKIEKAKVFDSTGALTSNWPFYDQLDALIGSAVPAKKPSPPVSRNISLALALPPSSSVPVGPRSKRPAPVAGDELFFRRNFLAAAAAVAEDGFGSGTESESESSRASRGSRRPQLPRDINWCGELARAMERFGEIYERVEGAKQRQMVELEKQRMQLAKDLECQRMQLLMDTQVQLEKIKRAKRSAGAGFDIHLRA